MPRESKTDQEHREAIAAAEKAAQDNPTDVKLVEKLGWAYFDATRYDEAMAAFQRVLKLEPTAAPAYNAIGRVRERTGPPEKAIEAYQRAIALDPQYVVPYYGLGIIYAFELGDYDPALEAFRHALEHNPEDSFLIALIGDTYARMGQMDDAVAFLQKAIRFEPDSASAYSNLSIVYLHLGRYEDVIAACRREIEIEDSHEPRRLLGYVYDHLGRRQAAIAELERSVTLNPEDYEDVIEACRREIEIEDSHEPRRLLGYVYDHLGRHQAATAELERSVTLNPEDYEARAALAKVYRTVGRQEDADEQYALARERAEREDEYGRACFEAVSGNVEQALALLQVGLAKGQLQPGWARIDPEFAFIKDDPRFRALIGD